MIAAATTGPANSANGTTGKNVSKTTTTTTTTAKTTNKKKPSNISQLLERKSFSMHSHQMWPIKKKIDLWSEIRLN